MACYHPVHGYQSSWLTPNGKRVMVMNKKDSWLGMPMVRPCGQCVGCRLERSRRWAVRCTHEASLYDWNCFITLTYAPEHLPENGTLVKKHFQDFMKRFRKRFVGYNEVSYVVDGETVVSRPIRFYHCGEYGDKGGRPHYHALIFNFDFPDKVVVGSNPYTKDVYYSSPSLQELWPFGYVVVGALTFESAAYTARYVMKKVNGDLAVDHYRDVDILTGEVFERLPEYSTMSRAPGIGRLWYDKFKDDVYPGDFVVMNDKKMRPPPYYDGLYELDSPDLFQELKRLRKVKALKHVDNNTPERLAIRETVQKARLNLLIRNVE